MLAVSSSLTTVTLFEPIPPKKPVPVIVTAVEDRLEPIEGSIAVTTGTGIAATVKMVVAVALSNNPTLKAAAFTVAVLDCVNAPEYIVDPVVGVEPSSVYLIVAPEVPVVIVIVTEPVYVPAAGVMAGAAT